MTKHIYRHYCNPSHLEKLDKEKDCNCYVREAIMKKKNMKTFHKGGEGGGRGESVRFHTLIQKF